MSLAITWTSGSVVVCFLLLAIVGLNNAASQMQDNAAEMLLRRKLLDVDNDKVTDLDDRMLAFLTKYEENFDYAPITTSPQAYALWGWQKDEKAIKYAVVGSSSQALSASNGDDIKYIHLHVNGTRGTNSTDKLALPKNNGTWPAIDGYSIYAAGTITDTMVGAWNNSAGVKTAKDLWDIVVKGDTYTNIHTTKYPDGEARGQNDWDYESLEVVEDLIDEDLRKNDSNWRLAFLTPYEETHVVAGNKTARAMGVFAWDGKVLMYHILSGPKASDKLSANSYGDIVGAHIHVGAKRGENSSSIVLLTVPTGTEFRATNGLKVYAEGNISDADIKSYTSNTDNKVPLASVAALWQLILDGKAYANVHTALNKAGEIRGQIDWNYEAVDVTKEAITPVNKTASKGSAAAALPAPAMSSLLGAAFAFLLLIAAL